MALHLAADIIHGVGTAEHRLLHGDLEVLDAPLFIVLRRFDLLGDLEEAAFAFAVAEAHRLDALRVVANELAFAQDHTGSVDILADDGE